MKQAEAVRLISEYPRFQSCAGGGDALTRQISQALQYERMMQGLQHADQDLEARMENGEVPGFIEQFLQQHWRPVLAHAYCEADEAHCNALLQLMDDLIWSVQPKFVQEQCLECLQRLPGMMNALESTLDQSEWHGAGRMAFFKTLAERHSLVVRGPVSSRRKIEMAVNSAQKASERRWEQESRAQALAEDQSMLAARAMKLGEWVEILNDTENALHYYKLAWISPRHAILVFIERNGQDFFSLTIEQLALRLHDHRARVLPQGVPT